MRERVLELSCPCCGEAIVVDPRTGRARPAGRPRETGDEGLDDLLEQQRREGERLAELFDDARQQDGSEKDRRERLFSEAEREARDSDEKPPGPFDLE